jgi:hypothetical protein
MVKSPFLVYPEFVSPLVAEQIIDAANFTVPDRDKDEHDVKTVRPAGPIEPLILDKIYGIIPNINEYYGVTYKGTDHIDVEWFPTGSSGGFRSENSKYIRQKWVRVSPRDLTGVLFLTDFQDRPPFDIDFEVCGGKLEFPQHNFGFNPSRGTLVIFPSGPHFINGTTEIAAGDLFQVRFHIVNTDPYWYNPENFPGNYTTWFK